MLSIKIMSSSEEWYMLGASDYISYAVWPFSSKGVDPGEKKKWSQKILEIYVYLDTAKQFQTCKVMLLLEW